MTQSLILAIVSVLAIAAGAVCLHRSRGHSAKLMKLTGVLLVTAGTLTGATALGFVPYWPPHVGVSPASGPSKIAAVRGVNDTSRGQLLYENHCAGCHESQVHVREDRHAASASDVEDQVRRWSTEQKLGWTDDDVLDVTDYLVRHYYRFDAASPRN